MSMTDSSAVLDFYASEHQSECLGRELSWLETTILPGNADGSAKRQPEDGLMHIPGDEE